MEPQRPVEVGSAGRPVTGSDADSRQEAPPDARELVRRLVAAGEWPEPSLVEQVQALGDAAAEPLLEVLRTRPVGWPAEAPIVHAAGILSMIRPPSALPDLIAAARFYKDEIGRAVAEAIASYGPESFDTLLKLIDDRAITGFHRGYFIENAKVVAGDDPGRRARLAEILRRIFTQVGGELKAEVALYRQRRNAGKDDEENVESHGELGDEIDENDQEMRDDEELIEPSGKSLEDVGTELAAQRGDVDELKAIRQMDAENEADKYTVLSLLASDLTDLADPLARDMIQSAFDEELIDETIIDRKTDREIYERGGEIYGPNPPWADQYAGSYLENQRHLERMARTPEVKFPSRISYPDFSPGRKDAPPAPVQPVETFRYTARAKIGRNDPCWCGSGKKYKKCHLGQDAPE